MLCHSLRVVLVEVRYRIDLHGRTNAEDLDGPQDAGQGDVHPGTQGPHGNDAGCCCGHVSIVAQRGSLPDDGFPMVGRCSGNVQVHPQAALFATGVADAGRRTGWAAADFAIGRRRWEPQRGQRGAWMNRTRIGSFGSRRGRPTLLHLRPVGCVWRIGLVWLVWLVWCQKFNQAACSHERSRQQFQD